MAEENNKQLSSFCRSPNFINFRAWNISRQKQNWIIYRLRNLARQMPSYWLEISWMPTFELVMTLLCAFANFSGAFSLYWIICGKRRKIVVAFSNLPICFRKSNSNIDNTAQSKNFKLIESIGFSPAFKKHYACDKLRFLTILSRPIYYDCLDGHKIDVNFLQLMP